MTILYIDQTGQLGGGELSLLDWLRISPDGARAILFEDGPFRPMLEELGIPVEVFPFASLKGIRRESGLLSIFFLLPALEKLRQRLAKAALEADVLYANSQKAFLLAAIAKQPGQPLIWHLRDILSAEHFNPILRKIAVATGNRFATAIIVNSQATADAFVAAGGKPEKLRIVPDGVNSRPFDDLNLGSLTHLRKEICPQGKFLVGVFGRLAIGKVSTCYSKPSLLSPTLIFALSAMHSSANIPMRRPFGPGPRCPIWRDASISLAFAGISPIS